MVRAIVTQPVYAYEGRTVLIQPGSRLVGQYATLMGNGAATRRVCIIWNRVITPQGISIMINSLSTDVLGRSGQDANAIDTHFWQIFSNAALLSIIGAGVANVDVASNDQPNSTDAYRQAIANSFQHSASKALNQDLAIQPTLHIYQGTAINVFVAQDVDFTDGSEE
jgi:type IV secretion system protein VirB10